MAIGVLSDMTQFDEQFYGGFIEAVQTNLNVFNQESLGMMNLSTLFHRGFREEEAYFSDDITVQDRDPNSVAAITPDSLNSDLVKRVKLYKHIFVEQALQSFRNQGIPEEEMAFLVGRKSGMRILEKWRESAVSALTGAFELAALQPGGADESVYDHTGTTGQANGVNGSFEIDALINAMPLFGDASNRLVGLVMHSAVYWKLVANSAKDLATPSTADFAVQAGMPATLGKPIIVVDSPALVAAGAGPSGKDVYKSFLLTSNAVTVRESEAPFTATDLKLDKENSTRQFKTELAYTVGLKGISYSSATDHPTDAELATSAVWTKKYTSNRDLPGIMIETLVN